MILDKLGVKDPRAPDAQKKIRMFCALYAYSYEVKNFSIVSDLDYDELARVVDVSVKTDRPDLDDFFIKEFSSATGMWIHRHPEISRIEQIYNFVRSRTTEQKTDDCKIEQDFTIEEDFVLEEEDFKLE